MNKNSPTLVPQHLLKTFASQSSTRTLDMHDPLYSIGEIIQWRGKAWLCTGYVSFRHKVRSLDLREVLPISMWNKPFNDLKKRGSAYYTGGRFHPKGSPRETWVMTEKEIRLEPDPEAVPPLVQQELFNALEMK